MLRQPRRVGSRGLMLELYERYSVAHRRLVVAETQESAGNYWRKGGITDGCMWSGRDRGGNGWLVTDLVTTSSSLVSRNSRGVERWWYGQVQATGRWNDEEEQKSATASRKERLRDGFGSRGPFIQEPRPHLSEREQATGESMSGSWAGLGWRRTRAEKESGGGGGWQAGTHARAWVGQGPPDAPAVMELELSIQWLVSTGAADRSRWGSLSAPQQRLLGF